MSSAISVAITAANRYVPRVRNELHTIFERHFADFCEHYNEKYAATYGRYRLERSMVEVFRRRVIKLLVDRELLNEDFAETLLSWNYSGFSQVAWASRWF